GGQDSKRPRPRVRPRLCGCAGRRPRRGRGRTGHRAAAHARAARRERRSLDLLAKTSGVVYRRSMSARLTLALLAVEAAVATAANRILFGRPFADLQGGPHALARWQGAPHGHRWLHRHAELVGLNAFLTTLPVLSAGAMIVTLLLLVASGEGATAECDGRDADTVPLPARSASLLVG